MTSDIFLTSVPSLFECLRRIGLGILFKRGISSSLRSETEPQEILDDLGDKSGAPARAPTLPKCQSRMIVARIEPGPAGRAQPLI
jgi:hypothetical protein